MTSIGVIGAGNWGRNLIRTFYELGTLKVVAEPEESLRERIGKNYPEVIVHSDYTDALKERIDAVVIATPAETHYQIARAAIEAGRDVFVEKPITLNRFEAEVLVNLARHHGRVLMVGHLLLYQPAITRIKEIIDRGDIGNLRSIHQERLKLGRVRKVENVLWSFGVHDVAVFLHLIGQSPTNLEVVGHGILQSGIEDDVHLHLSFGHEVQAHLHVSWLWPETRRRLTVVGTEGMLVYDESDGVVTLHRKGVNNDLSHYNIGQEIVCEAQLQPLGLECQHFLDCVRYRSIPKSDGQNGLEVVQILECASRKLTG